jgi:NhaP-type Na+/H+ and K+/H+ antiporter
MKELQGRVAFDLALTQAELLEPALPLGPTARFVGRRIVNDSETIRAVKVMYAMKSGERARTVAQLVTKLLRFYRDTDL